MNPFFLDEEEYFETINEERGASSSSEENSDDSAPTYSKHNGSNHSDSPGTSNRLKKASIYDRLWKREIGIRTSFPKPCRSIAHTTFKFHNQKGPGSFRNYHYMMGRILKNEKCGFLGMSRNGVYLIALSLYREEIRALFFTLDGSIAALAMEAHSKTREDIPFMRVYEPNNSHFFLLHSMKRCCETSLENTNHEVHIEMVLPEEKVLLSFQFIATCIWRATDNKKSFFRISEEGFVFNNCTSLVAARVSKFIPDYSKVPGGYFIVRTWKVVEGNSFDELFETSVPNVSTNVGEIIWASSANPRLAKKDLHLQEITKRSKLKEEDKKGLFLTTLTLNFDAIIDSLIPKNIRKIDRLKGSKYLGCTDYEVDILDVYKEKFSSICKFVIFAVCEIQVCCGPKPGLALHQENSEENVTRNEFHLFRVQMEWNMTTGIPATKAITIVKRLNPDRAFQTTRWYPLKKYPFVGNDDMRFISNEHIFTKKKPTALHSTKKMPPDRISESPPPPPRVLRIFRRDYLSVFVLLLVNLLNYMDRYTIVGVLDRLTTYFSMNDKQSGMLQTVFIVFYMIFAPLFGYLGDRYNRKLLMIVGLAVWIVAVMLSSFVGPQHYMLFLLLRGVVGIGEASYSTVAPTIIADTFTGSARSRVLMIFYFAIPVGSGLGFICGSHIALLFDSWQWGIRFTPLIGIICLSMIVFVLEEPVRGGSEGARTHTGPTSLLEDLRYLTKIRTYHLTTLGSTAGIFAVGALSWWTPSLVGHGYAIIHGLKVVPLDEQASLQLVFGLITCAAGIIGVVLGSFVAQMWRDGKGIFAGHASHRADALVCGYGALIALPFLFSALVVADRSITATWILIFVAITSMCLNWAVNMDILMYVVVANRRATAIAVQTLIAHLFGDATSPYVVGIVSDAIRGTGDSQFELFKGLQTALFLPTFLLVACGAFYLASSFFVEEDRLEAVSDMEANDVWTPDDSDSDDLAPLVEGYNAEDVFGTGQDNNVYNNGAQNFVDFSILPNVITDNWHEGRFRTEADEASPICKVPSSELKDADETSDEDETS
ncbi:unnamed protein product [Caenorhabditis auriculariae]|uniref:Major facilitator superfamily (MFS) profile domain-containing protein n=1 Tax=Caenorhabditis auriculariae TaxID=2777116 RepID=A0A8S1HTG6_9PELO|nr:unnamed protein product [Caenorhabditis auriculariae]